LKKSIFLADNNTFFVSLLLYALHCRHGSSRLCVTIRLSFIASYCCAPKLPMPYECLCHMNAYAVKKISISDVTDSLVTQVRENASRVKCAKFADKLNRTRSSPVNSPVRSPNLTSLSVQYCETVNGLRKQL